MSAKQFKTSPKRRFAVGAEVRVKLPGVNGVVTQLDSSPTVLGQYWHTVSTQFGDRREPGSNLELIPASMTNSKSRNLSIPANHQMPLPTDQAISLLRAQLQEPVEDLHHDDPEVDSWERVTQRIVERAFGERSKNANHFAATLSYARQSENEKQAWHANHIREKKGLLRAFIKELEIIPPHHPQPQDDRFARMAVEEARKSAAEDDRAHPMVGCVVVKDGQLLGKAHRGEMEGNHAEFIALEKKLGDVALTGCTVYTTLEPCTTRNHPKIPCADRLIERKVARVVIGTLDPNPEIRGKGMWKLQQANIAVETFPHALAMELNELNRHFFRSFTEPVTVAGQAQKERERHTLSCDFSPRALLLSTELSLRAFPLVQESNWSEEIEIAVSADTSEIDSIFSRFRGHKGHMVVAYGFDVAIARLKSINRVGSSGTAIWKAKFEPTRTEFSNDEETGTASTSADQFAEKRVRRLLLNENPTAFKSDKADTVGLMNEAMIENLVQGLNSIVKIKRSGFIDLYSDFGADPQKFIEIAWISAIADLKLSASVEHINHLKLELSGDVLSVDFSGRRHRKYVNVDPYRINVKGFLDLQEAQEQKRE